MTSLLYLSYKPIYFSSNYLDLKNAKKIENNICVIFLLAEYHKEDQRQTDENVTKYDAEKPEAQIDTSKHT